MTRLLCIWVGFTLLGVGYNLWFIFHEHHWLMQ